MSGSPADPAAAVVLETRVENDYHAMHPVRVTHPNGIVSEVCLDPLRMVVATSLYGTKAGSPAGDQPLSPDPTGAATLQDVLADPGRFLGNATAFFFYDIQAWAERGSPTAVLGLQRHTHVHSLAPGESKRIQQSVVYSDGLNRAVEAMLRADPAPGTGTSRWIISERTLYIAGSNQSEVALKEYRYSAKVREDSTGRYGY